MLTLEQFRESGRDVEDLGVELPGQDLDGKPGRVYLGKGGLWMERLKNGEFILYLFHESFIGDKAELEERLFEFAKDEGWICTEHRDTGRGVCANCQEAM